MAPILRSFSCAAAAAMILAAGSASLSAGKVGEPAPSFSAVDNQQKTHRLADYKGKFVVLEWHNQGCPYVQKHYGSGNMQALQKDWTARGVVWLSVISSAPGQQGYVTPEQSQEFVKAKKAEPTAVLLDPAGDLGHAYGAKTSPHMFVINPDGVVVYNGAIDDRPTTDLADIQGAKNYVSAALSEAMASKPVTTASTQPYGCSVKYAR